MTKKHFNEINKILAKRYNETITPEEGELIIKLVKDIGDIGLFFNDRFDYQIWLDTFKKNVHCDANN